MGDEAIAYAIIKFFKDNFKEYELIEIERDEYYACAKKIKSIVNSDDLVAIQGGGNMGNLYLREELARQIVIKDINNCKVISMPTTLSFTDGKDGVTFKKRMKKIYSSNSNLLLFAREEKSYNMMQKMFSNKSK